MFSYCHCSSYLEVEPGCISGDNQWTSQYDMCHRASPWVQIMKIQGCSTSENVHYQWLLGAKLEASGQKCCKYLWLGVVLNNRTVCRQTPAVELMTYNSSCWSCRRPLTGSKIKWPELLSVKLWLDVCGLCTLLALWHDIMNDNFDFAESFKGMGTTFIEALSNMFAIGSQDPTMNALSSIMHIWAVCPQNHLLSQIAAMSQ